MRVYNRTREQIEESVRALQAIKLSPAEWARRGISIVQDGVKRTAYGISVAMSVFLCVCCHANSIIFQMRK